MDLYTIPLYYISFEKHSDIEQYYKNRGFKNINHFKAINGKQFDVEKLVENGVITIRCYDDIVNGRSTHNGMPSLGGIGCTLSHYSLWKRCIDDKLPFIIIAEEDNLFRRDITEEDKENIRLAIERKNGVFLTVDVRDVNNEIQFMGTQFYIISNGACRVLVNHCFPIDIQTDWYMAHMATRGDVNVDGYQLTTQKTHESSIQNICFKCILPTASTFYIFIILFILCILIGIFYYRHKYIDCSSSEQS